jgi:hypothetical protein
MSLNFDEWFPNAPMDESLRQKMAERGKIPPSLPRDNPTKSYWQEPESDIASLRGTEQLPEGADYVVVGSGITGACIAWNLLRKNSAASVVMLEARGAVSGATGRNGECCIDLYLAAGIHERSIEHPDEVIYCFVAHLGVGVSVDP